MKYTLQETKKEIRDLLRKQFPGVKFSIRKNAFFYRIFWANGPSDPQVQGLTRIFENAVLEEKGQ